MCGLGHQTARPAQSAGLRLHLLCGPFPETGSFPPGLQLALALGWAALGLICGRCHSVVTGVMTGHLAPPRGGRQCRGLRGQQTQRSSGKPESRGPQQTLPGRSWNRSLLPLPRPTPEPPSSVTQAPRWGSQASSSPWVLASNARPRPPPTPLKSSSRSKTPHRTLIPGGSCSGWFRARPSGTLLEAHGNTHSTAKRHAFCSGQGRPAPRFLSLGCGRLHNGLSLMLGDPEEVGPPDGGWCASWPHRFGAVCPQATLLTSLRLGFYHL